MDSMYSIEQESIGRISADLRFFGRQSNAYRFLCPYCQHGHKNKKGKIYASGDAKGYLYQKLNSWNYKCHRQSCSSNSAAGKGKSFEKFLSDHFPKEHLEYVRRRDQLGLTGFQTNCPSLETVLKNQGVLKTTPPVFDQRLSQEEQQHTPKLSKKVNTSVGQKVTKLPPMRSPQQQAGHQSHLNHLVKQREQERRRREGW